MTPLRDLVRQKLSIASSQLGDQAAPAAWVQAFNAQLAWAQDALQAAAGSLEARWRWPPPECAPQALEGLPQPGWYSADYQSRLQQALQAARLPDFPAAVADPGKHSSRGTCFLQSSALHPSLCCCGTGRVCKVSWVGAGLLEPFK